MRLRHLLIPFLCLPAAPSASAELPFATAVAEAAAVPEERVFDGIIEAEHQATVSAQVSGRVVEVRVDVDDYVEKGAVLLRFRDTEQRAAYKAALARYEEARAEFRRVKEVYEKKLVARAAYDRAEAALKAARAELERAREALDNTVVRAPYTGIVVKRHIQPGEHARVGQKLMTGLSLESLRATTHVPQGLVNQVRRNRRATITLPNGEVVTTERLVISPYADPATHTFQVRASLESGRAGIYPGMFVKMAFRVGESRRVVVPRRAVAYRSEVTAVYVVAGDAVRLRQVRLGRRLDGDRQVVLAALKAGEAVALDPALAAAWLAERRGQAGE